jgi:integrase
VVDQFKDALGAKARGDISNVTAADISRFRDAMARKLSRGTVNGGLKIMRSAFGQARRDGLVDVNEAERVPILKKRQSESFERRPFTLDELKRILAAAKDEWKGIILTGLYTGQRLGDIATLTQVNLDLQQQQLQLVTQKTGRRQNIPLAGPLLRYFEALPSSDIPDAPLFPKAFAVVQESGRVSQLSNQFYNILVAANLAKRKTHHAPKDAEKRKGRSAKRELNPISFHSIRHTATSLLKRAGVSDVVAREIIGHDSEDVSKIYTHIDTATLKAALDKLPNIQ